MPRKRRSTLWRNVEVPATVRSMRQAMVRHVQRTMAKDEYSATALDRYYALCYSVRDRLVNRWINTHPDVSPMLRVIFVPNYNVSKAELLFPAADVSEQISTAGFEASGTGNMKFALNGALTLGTLDGANIEIAREVGKENLFIFGHTMEEVAALQHQGSEPRRIYDNDPDLAEALDLISGGHFSPEEPDRHRPLVEELLERDFYLHLADFRAYADAHLEVDRAYSDQTRWRAMAIKNIANVGPFSSDRTIRDYVRDIWRVKQHPVIVE